MYSLVTLNFPACIFSCKSHTKCTHAPQHFHKPISRKLSNAPFTTFTQANNKRIPRNWGIKQSSNVQWSTLLVHHSQAVPYNLFTTSFYMSNSSKDQLSLILCSGQDAQTWNGHNSEILVSTWVPGSNNPA